jgi:hypothetical protein
MDNKQISNKLARLIPIFFIVGIVLLSLLELNAQAPSNIESRPWQSYEGEGWTWVSANEKCASLGMRLLTRNELVTVYKLGLGTDWLKDGTWYWSSEDFSKERAYAVNMANGEVDNHYKNHAGRVRCIR